MLVAAQSVPLVLKGADAYHHNGQTDDVLVTLTQRMDLLSLADVLAAHTRHQTLEYGYDLVAAAAMALVPSHDPATTSGRTGSAGRGRVLLFPTKQQLGLRAKQQKNMRASNNPLDVFTPSLTRFFSVPNA